MRPLPGDERVQELLASIATGGGGVGVRARLDDELGGEADGLIEEFELAAAAGELAMMGGVEAMPASARAKVDAAADAFVAERAGGRDAAAAIPFETGVREVGRGSMTALAVAGWLAAAACMALAAIAWMNAGMGAPEALTPDQRLRALVESAGDVVRAGWVGVGDVEPIGAPDHPLDEGVTGEVVWSDARDEGYMRIGGVAANDPGEFQYQLWIFDAARPTGELPQFRIEGLPELLTQRPVDGGVFDVTGGAGGEVVVPIDAKLPVGEGVIFAVTKEPPGGVVVSDREIVFLAVRG